MAEHAEVPRRIAAKLRRVALDLPDAYEEQAWVGTRWRVRNHTFAHVVMIDADQPSGMAGLPSPVQQCPCPAADIEH